MHPHRVLFFYLHPHHQTLSQAVPIQMDVKDLITRQFPAPERDEIDITRITGDASNRQYFRVRTGKGTSVACIDPAFIAIPPEKYPFLIMRDLFATHGIRVPDILDCDNRDGFILLEDCGDRMLQDEVARLDELSLADLYRQIIDIIVNIQSIPTNGASIPFSLSFDHEKLMFEFDFFIEHGLRNLFRGVLDEKSIAGLRIEFDAISALLDRPEHFVLNHRDFHSRNIMLLDGRPVIIDFQDARLGLPQYDAVSLLRDSYTSLERSLVEELKRYHFDQLKTHGLCTMNLEEYLRFFDLMAFQRNVKAIGTFSYQTAVAANRSFEPCIRPTLAFLSDYILARPELERAGRLLEPLIEGKGRPS